MEIIVKEFKLSRNDEYSRLLLRLIKSESDIVLPDVFNIARSNDDKFAELVNCFGVNASLGDDNFLTRLCHFDGHANKIKFLIENGIDLEFRCPQKHTALVNAALFGHTGYVKLLIAGGANTRSDRHDKISPLMATCSPKSNIEIAKFLFARGAGVNEITSHGTPLTSAARSGRLDLAKLFIERGADVNLISNKVTPLMNAAGEGQREMVKFLLNHYADVNQVNDDGDTALSFAYHFHQLSIAECLIKSGARRDIVNKSGKLPIDNLDVETRMMLAR